MAILIIVKIRDDYPTVTSGYIGLHWVTLVYQGYLVTCYLLVDTSVSSVSSVWANVHVTPRGVPSVPLV